MRHKLTRCSLLFLALISFLSPTPVLSQGKRKALVIGNNVYPALPANRQLQKAINDARVMDATLGEIGFLVTRIENAARAEMSRAFGTLEQNITPGDTVFLFFAGHGIDIAGTNYLLPSDFPSPLDKNGIILPTRTFRDASFNAAEVMAGLQDRGAHTVIAVFDACREPIADGEESRRSLGMTRGGLAEMKANSGMFIMFSAGAKQLALDQLPNENHPNSVFTRTLVPLLKEPGLSLVSIAKRLQPRVQELANTIGHIQTPAYYDQIIGDFFLIPDPCTSAADHWKSTEQLGTKAALEDHLRRYPRCMFSDLAQAKLAKLAPVPPPATLDNTPRVGGAPPLQAPPTVIAGNDGAEMVLVPAGWFEMGSTVKEVEAAYQLAKKYVSEVNNAWYQPEQPRHKVWIDDFFMDKYKVTLGEYQVFVRAASHRELPDWISQYAYEAQHPVIGVSWEDANAYCRWRKKRLPTEAQWEKAARSPDGRPYPWGSESVDGARANYCDMSCEFSWKDKNQQDGFHYLAPVGAHELGKSYYGIYDLAGNVWEWVQDWYDGEYYRTSPERNPVNTQETLSRVVRGGSWDSDPSFIRASYRGWRDPDSRTHFVGFRCVSLLAAPEP